MKKEDIRIAWDRYNEAEMHKVFELGNRYREFISANKTERRCVDTFIELSKEKGYKNLNDIITSGETLRAGDKVYVDNYGKSLCLFVIGTEPFEMGLRLLGAHIDSPRLDLKQNPLYEDTGFAMMKTHYYGGIKKYQWVALPLAMHGVLVKKDGTVIDINIGDGENDPVFGVSDLLIHLAKDQMEKALKDAFTGEDLNVCVGNIPLKSDNEKENRVKANILRILKEKYDIEEEDFISAEIEIVPAGAARDFGLDRSMIMGYGHDDRVCAYTSFEAMMEIEEPEKTCVTLLVDKEEIGSVGATGMHSRFFENALAEIMNISGDYSEIKLRRALANSNMLSSDVSVAYDPNYPSVVEKQNCAYFGRGVVFNKYTGSGGKAGSNDASAEYIAKIRDIMDKHNVIWQTSELGKVDQGGGGTIAYILANYGMNVIDCGVPVHNMHAPWEVVCKADIYEAVKCYRAFLLEA
ncbi:MAG TPA: aminopeptidase [Clostridiales bacterium]|nr:aminopeptidase [Clostridiales bacterium]